MQGKKHNILYLFDGMRFGFYTYTDMKIINKYFSRQLVAIFFMLLMVLTGLAWMVQIMSMMKFLLNYGVDLGSFIGMTAMMIPFIMSIVVPFVTFIAVMFIYNKLISDNEITVMAASGMSPRGLAMPAIWFAGIITALHLILSIWIVPSTQAKFYDTQWNLRYGMAHMKLQEGAFTELNDGLVVYVDKVSGHDLAQVMLSDQRADNSWQTIFAEKGKLISTPRGLSIVMTNGSLQATGNAMVTGTFDTFDMDLNIVDNGGNNSYRVRRVSTENLIKSLLDSPSEKRHKIVLTELSNRFLMPIMNLVLTVLCMCVLLRSSLLRRRASVAPAIAVALMATVMALFMSGSNMISSLTGFAILTLLEFVLLVGLFVILARK